VLTEVRLRDAWLLAILAALPALALTLLGLRALRGEEAAVRREAATAVEAAAHTAALDLEAALDGLGASLATTSVVGDDLAVLGALRGLSSPLAGDPFVFDTSPLRLRAPLFADEGPPHDDGPPSAACRAALDTHDRGAALSACVHARGPSGRFLFPVLALDPVGPLDTAALEPWIRQHQARLSGTERAAVRADALRAGRPTVVALLDATTGVSLDLAAVMLDPAWDRALRGVTGPVATVRVAGGLARARRLGDGRLIGVFVGPAAMGTWLSARSTTGLRFRLAPPSAARIDPPTAWVRITPTLGVHVEHGDPAALARATTRSRLVLGAIAVAGAALALLGAWLTVARLRRERENAALRTDFVSTVSHELRTPIASIRMLSELLEQGRVSGDEQTELFAAIASESRRMGDTVERLLGFGRLAAGRSVATRKRVDVAVVLGAALDDFAARFPDAVIERELPPTEADVDADQLRLALDNLLANARKYAPKSACAVRLSSTADQLEIRVEDHGPGVARKDRRRVFQPFERGDARLSAATEGSGIGLSLVAHVATAHAGRAWIEDTRGGGATFVVALGRYT